MDISLSSGERVPRFAARPAGHEILYPPEIMGRFQRRERIYVEETGVVQIFSALLC